MREYEFWGENEEKVLNFVSSYKLAIINAYFKKREKGGKNRSEIYYFM